MNQFFNPYSEEELARQQYGGWYGGQHHGHFGHGPGYGHGFYGHHHHGYNPYPMNWGYGYPQHQGGWYGTGPTYGYGTGHGGSGYWY
ncbi:hypothetical protein [Bacillus andreraoultii]|uniref:hypothetical protein n=1 Tax=Bacillus andreraoultii TaxID=1499685 RepID=UPI0005AB0000|nr:hypothetical protein [Bacillus andreraoultii]